LVAANVKFHGTSPWHLRVLIMGKVVAANVKLHGTSPWHLRVLIMGKVVAANVKFHGTSPWHLRVLIMGKAVSSLRCLCLCVSVVMSTSSRYNRDHSGTETAQRRSKALAPVDLTR
jgi:hypothetical protein